MNYCIMCRTNCTILCKPYKSRGRFPYKSGAVCKNCLQKMQAYLMPKTKNELLALINKMMDEGAL